MRILFCNYEYPPLGGGGGVVNAALATELAKRHEVTVLTSRALGLPAESIEGGVRVLRAPALFRRRLATASFASMLSYVVTGKARGRKLLRERSFDVINTHFALPTGPVGDALSRAGGLPNVLSVHGGDLFDPSKFSSAHRHLVLRAWIRRLALSADAVVAQSLDTQENLRRFFVPDIRAHVIPLGIARPPAVAASRAERGFSNDDILLISIGRLVRRKSVEQLLELTSRLQDPRVKLLLLGDGPMRDSLEARAAQLGVAGQVRFLGMVDEQTKYELLALADLYVSSSQHEGFGLVFLEAMASGLPILCYDRGGQRDFLANGRSGYLVPNGDLDGLVERCRSLISDPAGRASIGAANRIEVERFFIEHCAQRYEDLFDAVIRAHAYSGSSRRQASKATGAQTQAAGSTK